jgi:hypothetical protein
MKDKNGSPLWVNDEVLHGEDEFYIAGENGDRILLWARDFDTYKDMTIEVRAESIVKIRRPMIRAFFLYFLSGVFRPQSLKFFRKYRLCPAEKEPSADSHHLATP